MAQTQLETFSKDDIITAVLESEALGTSKHQISLFKYLIDKKYDGTLDRVKAYTLAVDVFDRKPDFDSSTDSIVRVEMFRLRANLKNFNESSERFHLVLPKASYNIRITTKEETPQAPPSPYQSSFVSSKAKVLAALLALFAIIAISFFWGRHIGVQQQFACSSQLPLVHVKPPTGTSDLDLYLGRVILNTAEQFSHIDVVKDMEACGPKLTPRYAIEHSVIRQGSNYSGLLSLIALDKQSVIATHNVSGNMDLSKDVGEYSYDTLYVSIVKTINDWVMPNGVIHGDAVQSPWKVEASKRDYLCVKKMYQSFVLDSQEDYNTVRTCFEDAVKNSLTLPDNLGGLATSYLSEAALADDQLTSTLLKDADMLIKRAGDNWHNHVETTVAKIYYESEREDYNAQRLLRTLLRVQKRYPTNPVILLEAARFAGFRLGDWDYAAELASQAQRFQSSKDNSVFFIQAGLSLIDLSSHSLDQCVKIYSKQSAYSNLLVNACAIAFSDTQWINRTEENLERLGYSNKDKRLRYFINRKYEPKFLESLSIIWQIPLEL